jgi:hypothetical protein
MGYGGKAAVEGKPIGRMPFLVSSLRPRLLFFREGLLFLADESRDATGHS